jgi:nicotinate-nucleotide pyrophosphorylase
MIKFLRWFFSPSKSLILEEHINFYEKLQELEDRIKVLEEENVETTNSLYELSNSLEARIDILTLENWKNKDV